jgi:hypothetical protein
LRLEGKLAVVVIDLHKIAANSKKVRPKRMGRHTIFLGVRDYGNGKNTTTATNASNPARQTSNRPLSRRRDDQERTSFRLNLLIDVAEHPLGRFHLRR